MYELTHEPQLKGRMSWGVYDDDYDYDVDVYLWYPSSRPSIAELAGVENGFELPFVFERQADDQLDDATSYLPPPSPSYSVASDFVFPEGSCQQEMDKAGYSKFFSSGLVLTSQRVTRRLDGWFRTLRRHLRTVVQRLGG